VAEVSRGLWQFWKRDRISGDVPSPDPWLGEKGRCATVLLLPGAEPLYLSPGRCSAPGVPHLQAWHARCLAQSGRYPRMGRRWGVGGRVAARLPGSLDGSDASDGSAALGVFEMLHPRSTTTATGGGPRSAAGHSATPATGGVPCPGVGTLGRDRRHGESKSGSRPSYLSSVGAAVLIFPARGLGTARPRVCDPSPRICPTRPIRLDAPISHHTRWAQLRSMFKRAKPAGIPTAASLPAAPCKSSG
jgi:hypothetical protein